ncbi:MAG: DUF411 domain-containing protein [Mariprofundus sp.]
MINHLKTKRLWSRCFVAALLTLLFACNATEQIAANEPVSANEPISANEPSSSNKSPSTSQSATATEVVMYKSPGCKCCADWAKHLQAEGFTVTEHKRDDMNSIKAKYGVTEKLASCHTAIIGDYVIEGHVPAADIKRLLAEKPDVVGLTAPGMPMKSPGMQPEGLAPKNYDVLSFDKQGNSKIYSSYR